MTLSGRFCKKRILLGGKYSSGIWTAGRLGAGAAAPSTSNGISKVDEVRENKTARTFCSHTLRAELSLDRVGIPGLFYSEIRNQGDLRVEVPLTA